MAAVGAVCGAGWGTTGMILVLYILLVIIARTFYLY